MTGSCWYLSRTTKTLLIIPVLLLNVACTIPQSSDQAGPGSANKIQFQVHNQLATLRLGNLALVVDAAFGGRITEFSLDGKNALLSEGELSGSTFWTSPQKDWGWPPPAEIDSDPYEIQQQGNELKLISVIAPDLEVQVEKKFTSNAQGNGFDITYTLRNMSNRSIKLAPWEVTRVPGGYTFYPTTGNQVRNDLKTSAKDGITWYFYQLDELSDGNSHKVLEDATEGWIANVNPETGLLFIKRYPDISSAHFAPNEAEIELYASPRGDYIEIEQQGPYTTIPSMSSVDWTVTWYLQHIGTKNTISIGNTEMVQRARATHGL
jgi:hypothetical protein